MKNILAVIIAVTSIILALYLGIWVMFIGGVIQIIEGAKADPINSGMIAKGLLKFLFCSFSEIIAVVGLVGAYFIAFADKVMR